ncbi:epidermal growth factor-like protein 7 [Patiria miniata]|uniref:Epidermal growth factor-like protein 7 n=1 Tax=Patiria miniata TaxID=46514 RepID=A0A914AI03_PATMI|nr:epidermal growth factor-like protein 7 [Patiria miniata]XP_038063641.1 epidermal growth factor-like protein 7 [Patiria miniata]
MWKFLQVPFFGYTAFVLGVLGSLVIGNVDAYLHRYGRHVCTSASTNEISTGVIVESYCQPYFKPYFARCEPQGQLCTKYQTVYRMAYRTRSIAQESRGPKYVCCPGWKQHNPQANSCNEPVCSIECRNGGRCVAPESCACPPGYTGQYCEEVSCSVECANDGFCRTPDTCSCTGGWQGEFCEEALCLRSCEHGGRCVQPDSCACPNGWAGRYCHEDVDECETDSHGCHHRCMNSEGSFTCSCHPGFTLDEDGQSCSICLTCSAEYVALQDKVNLIEQNLGVMQAESATREDANVKVVNMPLNDEQMSKIELITSLSEQISMLEERLEDCTCKDYQNSRQYPRRRPNREKRSEEKRKKHSVTSNL